MLAKFLKSYTVTRDRGNTPRPEVLPSFVYTDFLHCIDFLGGKCFNNGMYQIYQWSEIVMATERVTRLYTPCKESILVFGADWLGQQLAIDSKEIIDGLPAVGVFNLGIPDSLSSDLDILQFHEYSMVQTPQDAIAANYYHSWNKSNPIDILPHQCVGYKLPCFLGGKDVLENLEVIDMDVYLRVCADLYHLVRQFPDGTPISTVLLKQGRATIFP